MAIRHNNFQGQQDAVDSPFDITVTTLLHTSLEVLSFVEITFGSVEPGQAIEAEDIAGP